jgi:hypothetical protein
LGQGATEYLVLLAIVLVVALVSVALLGFFPGMASDSREAQSKAYWQSAQPVAVVEAAAKYQSSDTHLYLHVENIGAYPVRVTKVLGNGQNISLYYSGSGNLNISDYYYLAPGEKAWFGNWNVFSGLGGVKGLVVRGSGNSATYYLYGASSLCTATGTPSNGVMVMKDFGFEYIEYIDNQPIIKREVGKPLVLKCI